MHATFSLFYVHWFPSKQPSFSILWDFCDTNSILQPYHLVPRCLFRRRALLLGRHLCQTLPARPQSPLARRLPHRQEHPAPPRRSAEAIPIVRPGRATRSRRVMPVSAPTSVLPSSAPMMATRAPIAFVMATDIATMSPTVVVLRGKHFVCITLTIQPVPSQGRDGMMVEEMQLSETTSNIRGFIHFVFEITLVLLGHHLRRLMFRLTMNLE